MPEMAQPAAARAPTAITLHAGCIAVGEAGVLMTGASGAGKSSLAFALLDLAAREGLFARLVSDDRTRLVARHGRLLAAPVPAIRGLIEARGEGLRRVPHEEAAVVRLVVELSVGEAPRLPDVQDAQVMHCGIRMPRIYVTASMGTAERILGLLRGFDGAAGTRR